jgi:hypothetical protein
MRADRAIADRETNAAARAEIKAKTQMDEQIRKWAADE